MSFRPKGEIPVTLRSRKIWQAENQFYPAKTLFAAAPEGFLDLWPRNDMRVSSSTTSH